MPAKTIKYNVISLAEFIGIDTPPKSAIYAVVVKHKKADSHKFFHNGKKIMFKNQPTFKTYGECLEDVRYITNFLSINYKIIGIAATTWSDSHIRKNA